MPFMDMPPGASLSSLAVKPYGAFIRRMRGITNTTANKEPKWRHNKDALTSGYDPPPGPDRADPTTEGPRA